MLKEALFVTKDKRGAEMMAAMVPYLNSEEPTIVAEAASLEVWDKAGYALFHRGPEKFNPSALSDFDIEELLHTLKPKVVIVGLSWPIHLEAKALVEARKKGIYTVAIVDNWGAHLRAPFADLYLCIDELAADLVRRSIDGSPSKPRNVQVVVVGDMAAAHTGTMDPKLVEIMTAIGKKGKTVLWGSQKWPESIHSLRLACESLAMSHAAGHKFTFIPRIHPGASDIDKKFWKECLDLYGNDASMFPVCWLDEEYGLKANSDHLAMLADITIAATGTGLRASAHNLRVPVCAWNLALSKKLEEEGAGFMHPLAAAGAAFHLDHALDLLGEIEHVQRHIMEREMKLLTARPYDPQIAADFVRQLAKW